MTLLFVVWLLQHKWRDIVAESTSRDAEIRGAPTEAETEATRDALELIRSLKKQYPDETEDQLVSRFQKEREADRAFQRLASRVRPREATELMAPFHSQR